MEDDQHQKVGVIHEFGNIAAEIRNNTIDGSSSSGGLSYESSDMGEDDYQKEQVYKVTARKPDSPTVSDKDSTSDTAGVKTAIYETKEEVAVSVSQEPMPPTPVAVPEAKPPMYNLPSPMDTYNPLK